MTSIFIKMRNVALVFILLFCVHCANAPEQSKKANMNAPSALTFDSTGVFVQPFQTAGGWGYDIFIDGKRYIHQPHQPAVGGNQPFVSETQARRVGALVAYKIENGIMPPSVTAIEVDSLIKSGN